MFRLWIRIVGGDCQGSGQQCQGHSSMRPDYLLKMVRPSAKPCRSAQLVRSSTAVTQLGFEPDSFDLGLWFHHEFTNRLEDNPKLGIVLLLQLIEASGKPLVRADHLSKLNKRSHDGNVYLDGAFAMEHARQHGYALFGERIGPVLSSTSVF